MRLLLSVTNHSLKPSQPLNLHQSKAMRSQILSKSCGQLICLKVRSPNCTNTCWSTRRRTCSLTWKTCHLTSVILLGRTWSSIRFHWLKQVLLQNHYPNNSSSSNSWVALNVTQFTRCQVSAECHHLPSQGFKDHPPNNHQDWRSPNLKHSTHQVPLVELPHLSSSTSNPPTSAFPHTKIRLAPWKKNCKNRVQTQNCKSSQNYRLKRKLLSQSPRIYHQSSVWN